MLGPETSKQYQRRRRVPAGAAVQRVGRLLVIAVDNTIGTLTIDQLLTNYQYFPDRILRAERHHHRCSTYAPTISVRGARKGLEVSLRGGVDAFGGVLSAGLDGTYLLKKREKLQPTRPIAAA